ncbi:DUF3775 domain-containing protein [Oricola thermophila]|uniref:DUF3775 domain-containing protein n=1 Tax=Oricola thermophila TaxID=2742145 RepID=A0A6N1V8M4_9HYPH|nr:DUF3775 domain-containing protein [Oricola thermophila]QKV17331.1 DUF3775 domain-containing protein [Oricola thermophila]
MADIAIDSGELEGLILRMRALLAREETDVSDPGGNPSDDEVPAALQELSGDLTRAEIVQEIEALNDDQQDALVALYWIGRGDAEPQEWNSTITLARQRHEGSTAEYLLAHPLVPDQIEEGWEKMRESGELE